MFKKCNIICLRCQLSFHQHSLIYLCSEAYLRKYRSLNDRRNNNSVGEESLCCEHLYGPMLSCEYFLKEKQIRKLYVHIYDTILTQYWFDWPVWWRKICPQQAVLAEEVKENQSRLGIERFGLYIVLSKAANFSPMRHCQNHILKGHRKNFETCLFAEGVTEENRSS